MEPSGLVSEIVQGAVERRMQGVGMVMERASEFPSTLQAQLTGIGLDPAARDYANAMVDRQFASNRNILSLPRTVVPEVVIGSGVHAATYAATRVLMGKPSPFIFERQEYAGGAFAIRSEDGTYPGVFNLNSRNRRGAPGLSGDNEAQLNYLPGAPIQASALSNAEYQTNADMAFITRLTLAQYAPRTTFPGIEVLGIKSANDAFEVTYRRNDSERTLLTRRILDARGLGEPKYESKANGATILTFPQFLQRMTQPWPLRGLRNVAVIGAGDSGKCAVESLLGLGPNPFMAAAELDQVNRVDWYGDIQADYNAYCESNRGRYRAIGRYLRPDKMGNRRLVVVGNRAELPVSLPGGPVLIGGRSYDAVILATGNRASVVSGLDYPYTQRVESTSGDRTLAVINEDDAFLDVKRYRIGPRANIRFDNDEVRAGVAAISNNSVAMFRLTTRTAGLAVQLD